MVGRNSRSPQRRCISCICFLTRSTTSRHSDRPPNFAGYPTPANRMNRRSYGPFLDVRGGDFIASSQPFHERCGIALNFLNDTLDLRTGNLRTHQRADGFSPTSLAACRYVVVFSAERASLEPFTGKGVLPMPNEEEQRLLAEVKKCFRLTLAAWSALHHPVRSVVHGSLAHRKLVQADAVARLRYEAAKAAPRAYR